MAATTITKLPLSHSPYVLRAVTVFALFPIGVGINALLNPRSALRLLEFPPAGSTNDDKLVDNLLRMYGVRDIAMGTTYAIVASLGHATALGWVFVANSLVALADGIVVKDQIGRGQWSHWGFVPVSLGIGSVLLGVFD